MDADSLKTVLETALPDCEIGVQGEGSNYSLRLVGARFEGLSRVRRQQEVYAAMGTLISDGTIHAVTIVAETPDEALKASRLNGPS